MKEVTQDPDKTKLNKQIGKRLKDLRKKYNLTQEQFIEKISFKDIDVDNNSTYSRYESGKTTIPLHILKGFCDFYGVTMDYLINGTETEPDKQIAEIISSMSQKEIETISRAFTKIAKCIEEK